MIPKNATASDVLILQSEPQYFVWKRVSSFWGKSNYLDKDLETNLYFVVYYLLIGNIDLLKEFQNSVEHKKKKKRITLLSIIWKAQ